MASLLVDTWYVISLLKFGQILFKYHTVGRVQVCVIIFEQLLIYKSCILIEFNCTQITAVDVQVNFGDVTLGTILNCFIEQLRSNLVASVRFEHIDGHDINNFVSRFFCFLLLGYLPRFWKASFCVPPRFFSAPMVPG